MLNPAYTIVFLGYSAIPIVLVIAFIFGRPNAERTRRTIKLERVRQGEYTLHLIVTTPDGRRAERRAGFQVSRESETASNR